MDPECPPEAAKLAADAPAYLVIDTNLALHQLDFLEHPAITDIIVTKTVLEEVRYGWGVRRGEGAEEWVATSAWGDTYQH